MPHSLLRHKKAQKELLIVNCFGALCAFLWLILARFFVALLSDRPASDPAAGVSRRIGLHVISLLMNDQRRAAIREERVCTIAHVHLHVVQRSLGSSVTTYREVVHIAGVWPIRVLHAVLFVVGIEMIARRFEARTFAVGHLMKVDGGLARRQVLQIQFDADALACIAQGSGAD